METTTTEIADGIYRFSTFVPEANLMFNQFLVKADEPLLFHTGLRQMFPLVSEALARSHQRRRLRWITFGHVEADECGSMNNWLAAAPNATVAHTAIGCMVSVNDLADRPPRPLEPGEVIDLGGKRVAALATPHVPHGWDADVYYEETTGTLFCGDLFTAVGTSPALTDRRHRRPGDRGRRHVPGHVPHAGDRTHDSVPRRPRAPHARARCTGRRSTAMRSPRSPTSPTPTRRGTLPQWAQPCERRGVADPLVELQVLLRPGVDRCRAARGSVRRCRHRQRRGRQELDRAAPERVVARNLGDVACRGRVDRRVPVPQPRARRSRLTMRKGFPESYDRDALSTFFDAVKAGDPGIRVPVYSHEEYDVLDEQQVLRRRRRRHRRGAAPAGCCRTRSMSGSTSTPPRSISSSGS